MQQNDVQAEVRTMTMSVGASKSLQILSQVPALSGARSNSLELLAEAAEEVRLTQGQTLLRGGAMETHGFLLLEGTLRLLGQDPVNNDLFTVGRLQPGALVGVIDLLRQGPCEAAIARQPCLLLSLPLGLLLDLMQDDERLLDGLAQLSSPCEGVSALNWTLNQLNPPPTDPQAWLLEQLKSSSEHQDQEALPESKALLSSVLP